MNKERFLDNFKKIYGDSKNETYIYKAAQPIFFLSYGCIGNSDHTISIGVNPDSGIGIRLNETGDFNLRFSDSNIEYNCKAEKLLEYSENNPAREYFRLLGKAIKNSGINGAEILLYREVTYEGFDNCKNSATYAFSDLFLKNKTISELADFVCENKKNYSDYLQISASLSSKKNCFCVTGHNNVTLFPALFDKYNIIIAVSEKKIQKQNFSALSNKIKKNTKDEYTSLLQMSDPSENLLCDLSESAYVQFIKNETNRKKSAIDFLQSGDICQFGKIAKDSAKEWLEISGKKADTIKTHFEIASCLSPVCGIFQNRGIFAFIEKENTDNFLKKTEEICKKRAEKKPFFLISESSETGRVL